MLGLIITLLLLAAMLSAGRQHDRAMAAIDETPNDPAAHVAGCGATLFALIIAALFIGWLSAAAAAFWTVGHGG